MSQTIESILSVVNSLLEMLEKKTKTCLQIQTMEQDIQAILSVLKRLLMVSTIECQRCCIPNHVLTSLAQTSANFGSSCMEHCHQFMFRL